MEKRFRYCRRFVNFSCWKLALKSAVWHKCWGILLQITIKVYLIISVEVPENKRILLGFRIFKVLLQVSLKVVFYCWNLILSCLFCKPAKQIWQYDQVLIWITFPICLLKWRIRTNSKILGCAPNEYLWFVCNYYVGIRALYRQKSKQ